MKISFLEPSIDNNCWVVAMVAESMTDYFRLRNKPIMTEKYQYGQKCLMSPVLEVSTVYADDEIQALLAQAVSRLRHNPQTKGFYKENSTVGVQLQILEKTISKAKSSKLLST